MSGLEQQIQIRAAYTRSINLPRDTENIELVRAYLPTSRAIQALRQIARGLGQATGNRALALIGPYGSGKSAFGLFLAALLGPKGSATHQAAIATLQAAEAALAEHFQQALTTRRGFLRVPINGVPDSLVRQVMSALVVAAEQNGFTKAEVSELRAAAHPGTPLDQVVGLIRKVQAVWSTQGGTGLLIEIDELGKFLEYESYHPQHREIHLLQLLAEHAQQAHAAPLQLVVLLQQSFEYYIDRLGKQLGDEWRKIQGRFEAIAFLEPAEQLLRVVAAAFEPTGPRPPAVEAQLTAWIARLAAEGALPLGLDERSACQQLGHCYPLHPLTLLILPVLCQKVAQNERTLFSYLGSREPFGLHERLGQMHLGDWIEPWELYDYFILNQAGGFADPLTYHRWVEVVTALERFDGPPDDPAVRLLKTIGLLNLIGAQRGLKASQPLLQLVFGDALGALLGRLEAASIIHFRHYSQEYRVWQGSDFDLHAALNQAVAEQASLPLVDILNQLALLKPIVARRATIKIGTLRCFVPGFTDRDRWPPKTQTDGELRLWFYLAAEQEEPRLPWGSAQEVVAFCPFTARLRETLVTWRALQDLPKRHATLHHDPVAQREHRAWLANAEAETMQLVRALLERPESLRWFWGGAEQPVRDRRDLQQQLSNWVEECCYPHAPLIKNELVNWEQPSASANTGRKRLLAAMLHAADQEDLGIEKSPAERSLYLSLLKASGLHRQEGGRFGFHAPPAEDPCRLQPVWEGITRVLGDRGHRQVELSEIYAVLQKPPYGVKLGVLPILLVAYLLAYHREVALYQEGAFCEVLTIDQVELLCRRPALFALERFELTGLRADLFERYLGSVVGHLHEDATLLDIVRPLVRFISSLPEYSQYCLGLSPEAESVRHAFRQAKSPGMLLFDALPRACGIAPEAFAADDSGVVERFIQQLIQVLRELKDAYQGLLVQWRQECQQLLLDAPVPDLAQFRQAVAERYCGLDRYSPQHSPVGTFVRRLADSGFPTDEAWFESVLTLLSHVPPAKWRESTRLQAELRLAELSSQLRDLEQLRQAMPDQINSRDAVLVKLVDVEQGEVSRVIRLSAEQRQLAVVVADQIAGNMEELDDATRVAVIATLLKRLAAKEIIGETNND